MSKERYTIGRLPDNDIRIDNPAVSGHHALIINILNDSFLEDLNSTNGIFVRGKRVTDKAHAKGISVEAELGMLGGVEEDIKVEEGHACLTDPDQAAETLKSL